MADMTSSIAALVTSYAMKLGIITAPSLTEYYYKHGQLLRIESVPNASGASQATKLCPLSSCPIGSPHHIEAGCYVRFSCKYSRSGCVVAWNNTVVHA
jgi:hypothetical protein